MQKCDGFVHENRSLVDKFVRNICDVSKASPNDLSSLDFGPITALWTCPDNRCRALTPRKHFECAKCNLKRT